MTSHSLKMAVPHCILLSTIQTSVTLIFNSILIGFVADCMIKYGLTFRILKLPSPLIQILEA